MKRVFQYILIAGLLVAPFAGGLTGQGQDVESRRNAPTISAVLTPDSISIGDHVRLRVEIEKDIVQIVEFPQFTDNKFGDDIIIINEEPADTTEEGTRRQKIVKEYLLTCFQPGYYQIGAFPVLYVDKNIVDTLFSSQQLQLMVTTFPVDTLMNTIFDIKKPEEAPVLVSEVKGYFITAVVIGCLIAAIVYLIWRRASRKKGPGAKGGKSKPKELPHVKAIRELETLHNQKLWQNDKHKLYYTHLIDIVRTYLEGRYGVWAMEMTSDEIMEAMGKQQLSDKNYKELREMLYTSDLVKFAKHVPDADDNERIYYEAYYFVENTKEIPEEVNENDKPVEITENEE